MILMRGGVKRQVEASWRLPCASSVLRRMNRRSGTCRALWGNSWLQGLGLGKQKELVTGNYERLDKRYTIQENVPKMEGRYGVVRAVECKATNEVWACKELLKSGPTASFDLSNELQVLQKVKHPHVIGITEAFEDDEKIYLISPMCKGGELFDRIISQGVFTERDAAHVIRQTLLALEYLHAQLCVTHRDVKPENLLYLDESENSPLCLIDFGMARAFDKGEHIFGACGSPAYVAPEVLDGVHSEKCDIWSTGVILYILLSGKMPFTGNSDEEILAQVSKAHVLFDDPAWADVSAEAQALVKELMNPEPSQRPSASQALRHSWIRSLGGGRDFPLEIALRNITSFQAHNKLKKLSLEVIARHLTSDAYNKKERYIFLSHLLEEFDKIDVDQNGLVPVEVVAQAILKRSASSNGFNVLANASELADRLRELDMDNNQKIEIHEFLAGALNPATLHDDDLMVGFHHFDKSKTGKITLKMLEKVYGDDALTEFEHLDLNSDGVVSFEEYAHHMRNSAPVPPKRD